MKRMLATLAATAVLVAGCSSSGGGGGGKTSSAPTGAGSGSTSDGALNGSITVYAAASLTEAFTTLKSQFEAAHAGTTITLKFGASSDLSTQINNGAPADVFASASKKNMTATTSAKNPTTFVKNTLEIAVPPSNPGKVTSVQDLAKSSVTVAVCAASVPCGVVARTVFTNAKIKVTPKANAADVKSTLALVTSNEVDAGLVYVTDVRAAGSKVKGIVIPAAVNASTDYPIATLSGSKNSALAQAFVTYVLSADGSKVLLADGFTSP